MAVSATRVVVTPADSPQVVAYYAWTMAQIRLADAPARLRKGAGRYPQPIALLARLGVHRDHEGNGLGAGLLRDVIQRVAAVSKEMAAAVCSCTAIRRGPKLHPHLVPEFEASPTDELHLVLLLKDIRRTLQAGGR